MATLGERLVEWLAAYGVRVVFGIPGVHTIEMYRGLASGRIAHVTPRHEQGAGFMADGWARITGQPGVAFVITGPGLTNILTAMAQAHADSVPMLVISSTNARGRLGMEAGDLHEVRRQGLMAAQAAAFSHQVQTVDEVPDVLARAWAGFDGARPRPVHIDVPRDLFAAEAGHVPFQVAARPMRPGPGAAALARMADDLAGAARPLILAGGGARRADLGALAARLGAPVVMTTNARGALGPDAPLAVPCSPSLEAVRALVAQSDVVLALGTEIGVTDYDMYDRAPLTVPGRLIRIDIDAEQLARGAPADLAVIADAAETVTALLARLGAGDPAPEGPTRAAAARVAARDEIGPRYRAALALLELVRDTLPAAPMVGDSTQAVYAGNLMFAARAPWFNAATGYGALGYGMPAAIGAARALGGPVVALVGDGGLQFTLADLGTAVEERLPVIVLVWNNQGYGEIKSAMLAAGVAPVGVDLVTPDFVALARAYGARGLRLDRLADLPDLLRAAATTAGPTLIEFDETVILGSPDAL